LVFQVLYDYKTEDGRIKGENKVAPIRADDHGIIPIISNREQFHARVQSEGDLYDSEQE